MRWGASRVEFVRPVHWVVAMLGTRWDHGEILGLPTGNTTRGHRFHSSGSIVLKRPEDYREALANAKVVASFEQRREMIRDQVEVEASAIKATAVMDENLLDEVTGLVEWPVALTGSFEARFLEVPAEALVSSMKEHQKYFHLVDAQGKLMPNFITIANIESKDPVQVIAGNERVIRPRLSDAAFFFDTDKKTRLDQRVAKLDSVVFQQQLGTLLDKTHRVMKVAAGLAERMGAAAGAGRARRPAEQGRPAHRDGAGVRRYAGRRRLLLRPARWRGAGRRRRDRPAVLAEIRRRPPARKPHCLRPGPGRSPRYPGGHLRDRPGPHRIPGSVRTAPGLSRRAAHHGRAPSWTWTCGTAWSWPPPSTRRGY